MLAMQLINSQHRSYLLSSTGDGGLNLRVIKQHRKFVNVEQFAKKASIILYCYVLLNRIWTYRSTINNNWMSELTGK